MRRFDQHNTFLLLQHKCPESKSAPLAFYFGVVIMRLQQRVI